DSQKEAQLAVAGPLLGQPTSQPLSSCAKEPHSVPPGSSCHGQSQFSVNSTPTNVVVVVVDVVVEVVLVVDVVVVVLVVVDVVGHGVVRGRHLRTNVSRSLRGLVPCAAVAFAESRTMAGCVSLLLSGSGIATKLPQAGPSSEPGTAPARLGGLTKRF